MYYNAITIFYQNLDKSVVKYGKYDQNSINIKNKYANHWIKIVPHFQKQDKKRPT